MKIDVVRLIADLVFEAIFRHSIDHGKRAKKNFYAVMERLGSSFAKTRL